ncbi:Fggy [Columba guinea]|nr:Fggy [Columba guinea]
MFASGLSILKDMFYSMSLKIDFAVAFTTGLSVPVSARNNYRQLVQMMLKYKVVCGVDARWIRGVGFDATCSLVVVDKQFQPLAVNCEGLEYEYLSDQQRLDYGISKCGHPEMSLCTLVCKWTYTSDGGWDDSFWKMIGLEDLVKDKYKKIGNHVLSPGEPVGKGLTPEAAKDLGLPEGIAVAASLIDAHAGGLGVIGADVKGYNLPCENQPITSRVAMICGTSSCHMGVSETPIFVPGVWGPYFSAMVPGLWLNEGGQSATGKLIDHVVRGHVAFPELQSKAAASAHSIYTYLNSHLDVIKKSLPVGFLTVDLHVWPDFHGNRSPLTDLTLKGMVVGLTLSRGLDELALIYLATIQAIALGTRHILETMQAAGHHINTLFLCGGLSKNPLFVQMHADITGKPVVLSKEVESVLVGAAILGACASGDFASIQRILERQRKEMVVLRHHAVHKECVKML